ncbi:hypothetical protein Tco_0267802 [Tanacetum coccineum]
MYTPYVEPCCATSSKNDKYVILFTLRILSFFSMTTFRNFELPSILEPGKLAKVDKDAILVDAVRELPHLRSEAQAERQIHKFIFDYFRVSVLLAGPRRKKSSPKKDGPFSDPVERDKKQNVIYEVARENKVPTSTTQNCATNATLRLLIHNISNYVELFKSTGSGGAKPLVSNSKSDATSAKGSLAPEMLWHQNSVTLASTSGSEAVPLHLRYLGLQGGAIVLRNVVGSGEIGLVIVVVVAGAFFNAAYKRAKRLGKSGENDVDYLKRAQSIYRDEHRGVAFSQEDAWAVLRFHPKWDAPEQVDLTGDVPGASQEDLSVTSRKTRPPAEQRPAKKSKSDATASTGGSSASAQFRELMEQELRLKREAAERISKLKPKKTARH